MFPAKFSNESEPNFLWRIAVQFTSRAKLSEACANASFADAVVLLDINGIPADRGRQALDKAALIVNWARRCNFLLKRIWFSVIN